MNLVTGVSEFVILVGGVGSPFNNPFPIGLGISEGTYKKILSVNGLTGTNTNTKELKGYKFTVSSLPDATLPHLQPLKWTLDGEISFNNLAPNIWLNVTSGGYPNLAAPRHGQECM